MRVIYFSSDTHPYHKAIYPGVGPDFAKPLAWETLPISRIGQGDFDLAVVDNRLEAGDVEHLRKHLALPAVRRPPLFFRVSDSDMPATTNPCTRFIFECADHPGVHFATTYDPEGPVLAFTKSLKLSRVVHLPYAYEASREVDVPLAARRRRVFLSGSNSRNLYPVRHDLRRRRAWFPWLRYYVFDLKHPGYPECGKPPLHDITRARFVALAAQFTHFFLCGTRYNVELMKYVECAYAGCVPVGIPPNSLSSSVGKYFRPYSGRTRDLVSDVSEALPVLDARAAGYRSTIRELRSPARVVGNFMEQVKSFGIG